MCVFVEFQVSSVGLEGRAYVGEQNSLFLGYRALEDLSAGTPSFSPSLIFLGHDALGLLLARA